MNKQTLIRITCILAILGGIINGIGDVLLIVGPFSGKGADIMTMATQIPYNTSLVGAVLGGALGMPMWLFILIPVYYAVKPAGNKFAVPVILLLGHVCIVGAIFHASYGIFHSAWYALANVGPESKPLLEAMIAKIDRFRIIMITLWMISAITGSIWLIVAILFRNTHYKRWMAIFTPLLCLPVIMISDQLPAPYGGYFAPYDGSLVFTLFFLITAKATWNYRE